MNILHIHQDYPDGFPYPSTKAVYNLINSCQLEDKGVKHYVVSINRTSNPFRVKLKKFEQGIAIIYWGLPLPYIYVVGLWFTAWFISLQIKHVDIDVIHGHKLTTEGLLAFFLSKKIKKPYVVSVRGGTDRRNLDRFPHHRNLFAEVFEGASSVFWVSMWMRPFIENKINCKVSDIYALPNICIINLKNYHSVRLEKKKYITAISFHQYKRKGIVLLIKAILELKEQGILIYLDIYGGGKKKYIDIVAREIAKHNLGSQVFIKGEVSQETLRTKMSQSKAFVLPSINETFGMSYIEALSVSCPICYMRNTGIDGYFDDYNIGINLNVQSVASIKEALLEFESANEAFDKGFDELHKENYLKSFSGGNVACSYLEKMQGALS